MKVSKKKCILSQKGCRHPYGCCRECDKYDACRNAAKCLNDNSKCGCYTPSE